MHIEYVDPNATSANDIPPKETGFILKYDNMIDETFNKIFLEFIKFYKENSITTRHKHLIYIIKKFEDVTAINEEYYTKNINLTNFYTFVTDYLLINSRVQYDMDDNIYVHLIDNESILLYYIEAVLTYILLKYNIINDQDKYITYEGIQDIINLFSLNSYKTLELFNKYDIANIYSSDDNNELLNSISLYSNHQNIAITLDRYKPRYDIIYHNDGWNEPIAVTINPERSNNNKNSIRSIKDVVYGIRNLKSTLNKIIRELFDDTVKLFK